ncbi:tellurite resistance TerB family protein [Actibacterium pelagium]|uniref:Co-chaperone DjlA N-terminal domain-containing protein n=1 Tax=Actibacterium pelagium TaxID=2029103 RepID=A0A917AH24_9RHOB|nr:TerB family tellurite resistance protein [Actibacterium pelagium]GGE50502.1 hypothetical protein GCM10011517_17790 [Actibacterium pelagium]
MFETLLARLKGAHSDTLPADDARLALATLLVRIAKSDHHYAFEEIVKIDEVLAERYDLSIIAAAKIRAQAEKVEAQSPECTDFSETVKSVIPYDDRAAIVVAMWKVIMADGVEREQEHEVFELSCSTLGVDPEDLRSKLDELST